MKPELWIRTVNPNKFHIKVDAEILCDIRAPAIIKVRDLEVSEYDKLPRGICNTCKWKWVSMKVGV